MESGKVVFFGTSDICLPFLDSLTENFEVPLIVTQPDARGGRKKQLIAPAVKEYAIEKNIDYIQPADLNEAEVIEKLDSVKADFFVVIAYGRLISKKVYNIPKYRAINVHFSLLPEYRGAAPVQRAIQNGDKETGITIFQINKKMDAGAIWAQTTFPIGPQDTTLTMWAMLSRLGAPFLIDTLKKIDSGEIELQKQAHPDATYAPPVSKAEGEIDWTMSAKAIINKMRAFHHWPCLCFTMHDKKFKIIDASEAPEVCSNIPEGSFPGDIINLGKNALAICCGEGSVLLVKEFQPQSKKAMTPHCYAMGNKLPESLN